MNEILFIAPGRSETAPPEQVGGKAHKLMRMAALGLPVPPAFVLGTSLCRAYFAAGEQLPDDFREQLATAVRTLEALSGCQFGGRRRPLLVSVRSGAPVSMPGMMETLLNIGLCDTSFTGLLRMTGNPALAWDSWRRLIQNFGEVVHGIPAGIFDQTLLARLQQTEADHAQMLDTADLRALTQANLEHYQQQTGLPFPQQPLDQLNAAVEAVFRSWNSPKARAYRSLHRIDPSLGTAVVVQTMVFGNAGGTSGSGVGFTRDPATGEDTLYLDFLFNAQGEDVVSGRHAIGRGPALADVLPEVHERLRQIKQLLEREFRDMQDFEFTVENRRLFLLQARNGKRTPWAALRIAVDMVDAGLISPAEALAQLARFDPASIRRVRLADPNQTPVAHAVPAGIGVASGVIALSAERAIELADAGTPVILVRQDIATEDIAGIAAAEGVLTAGGARTSHAAVVARQLGKVCLVGCTALRVESGRCRLGEQVFREGDYLTLDSDSGAIHTGRCELLEEQPVALLARIAQWRERHDQTSDSRV